MKLPSFISAVVILAGLAVAPPAAASPDAPVGFRVPATHGYSIHAIAFDGDALGEHDELILFVTRKGDGAAYFALRGATIGEGSIEADLGELGRVDLHFAPSGKPKRERSPCDPPFQVDSGRFVGHFEFEGEGGFAAAHATSAAGEDRVFASLVCPGGPMSEGVGGNSPGAQLHVRRRAPGGEVSLEVTENSATRPARFAASIEERRGDLVVDRSMHAVDAPSTFEFDVTAQMAWLRPPAPFAGSARFVRGAKLGRLAGDLTVDFPGRSDVSLAGARGSLHRWVANSSHPFRPQGANLVSLSPLFGYAEQRRQPR